MRLFPTASSLDLAFKCQGFVRLGKPAHEHPSDGMARGSGVHLFLQNIPTMGLREALKHVPTQYRELCESIEHGNLPQVAAGNTELSMVMMPDGSVERIGHDRDYGTWRGKGICGTADFVTSETIGDYKITDDDGYAGTPETHNQLRFLGSCFLELTGMDAVTLEIIQISPTSGKVTMRRHLYDRMESDVFVDRLWKHFRDEPLELYTPGDHCFFPFKCGSVSACPAHVGTMVRMLREVTGVDDMVLDAEKLPQIIAWLEPAKAVIDGLEKAVKEYHKDRTTTMPDGRRYGPTSRNIRTIIAPEKAVEVLARMGLDAKPLVKHETSMAIGPVEKLHPDAMAALEKEGCVATKKTAGAGWLAKGK